MKLFTKYTRINLLVMVIVFLLSVGSTYLLTNYVLIREMDADLAGIRDRLIVYYTQYHQLPAGHVLDEEQVTYEPAPGQMKDSEFKLVTRYSQREKKMHNFRQVVFTLPAGDHVYKVTIAKPMEGLHHLFRAFLWVSLVTIGITILAFLLTNRILLRRLWQPFYDAIHAMQNFRLGHTNDLRFPVTTTEEFAFMNESLGMAARKAEEDYLLLKEFTENASHELQTPLSIIRSKLEMLIQEEDLSQRQSEIVRSAFAAIKKLSRLNQSLLLLTKISNQQFNNLQEIPLDERIENKLGQFRELWQTSGIEVSSHLSPATIRASPELIDILLNNLLSNASNHNVPQGTIDISLESRCLSVSNTGLAEPLDPRRMFTRFYKGEQHTGHNGLGLSIIKQICEVTTLRPTYQFSGNRHTFVFTW
ncbi:MAG TPA: HAMP domain-containing sensor histidine kinase [Puia sp.]|jgi:signal transduction histidine kinase|nr:HAMP domain-containing sensor histidine kinase [Puia sp.]